jgi:hypothetical protein
VARNSRLPLEVRIRSIEREFSFYPEVSLQRDDTLQFVVISAPWLTIRVYAGDSSAAGSSVSFDVSENCLAQYLLQYPVASALTVQGAAFCETSRSSSPISPVLLDRRSSQLSLSHLPREDSEAFLLPWSWEIREILTASFIARNHYDSISAFTCIRRLIFQATLQTTTILSGAHIGPLLTAKPKNLLRFAVMVLNQSFHVTSQCVPSLNHFEAKPDEFSSELGAYIKQEAGHHNLIRAALAELGEQPSQDMVCEPIRGAMRLLTYAAKEHPFALANCIGLFEMASFGEKDELAELLGSAGAAGAAEPLLRHFEINKKENHAAIGFDLAQTLPFITEDDVVIAVCLAELLCRLLHLTAIHYSRYIARILSSDD